MITFRRTLLPFSLCSAIFAHAQFDAAQVEFWVGSGTDSSILVVDFQNSNFDGSSYAWGYLHNGSTGEEMLNAIAAADINFTVDIASGFLNSITYGANEGIGGAPDYWSTWSGTSLATLEMNVGISTTLGNGDWFGCSYTDFEPPLVPTAPIPSFDPFQFTADDVVLWLGAGQDSALLVIDFHDGAENTSYAWGFLFNGTTTGEEVLTAIAAADADLTAAISGGFLNDIIYADQQGLAGAPNYWSTWSATNLGNWSSNVGISTVISNGDLFGCSYTDFAPALRPGTPLPATFSSGLSPMSEQALMQVFPQPATDVIHIRTTVEGTTDLGLIDLAGKHVISGNIAGTSTVDVSGLVPGMYVLRVGDTDRTIIIQ